MTYGPARAVNGRAVLGAAPSAAGDAGRAGAGGAAAAGGGGSSE